MKHKTESEPATSTAMYDKPDFETGGFHYERPLFEKEEKKKKRAWRRNPSFRFTGQNRNMFQPVQMSPKSKRDLQPIAGMWDAASSLTATHKSGKDHPGTLPMGIALHKKRNGPSTGRRPGSKKSIILSPRYNEMGDAMAKKNRATGQERGQYCKSSYWKQKVYNMNYSRMQKARPFVQV